MRSRIKISTVFADDKKEVPVTENEVETAVELVCSSEKLFKGEISIIFAGDTKIRELNKRFLNHDRSTDVIAFSLEDDGEPLEGEIYICTDTAGSQAEEYSVTYENELLRLIIHGTLHLCGYEDSTEPEKAEMLELGEDYLAQLAEKTGSP
ncbi:MAG: rRNA maturation RNase YbeY [bacterium]|nr:rRNA maturation RNase YbeY [bacterium]